MTSRRLTFLQGLAFVSSVACSSSSSTDTSGTDTGAATDALTDTVTADGAPSDSTSADSTATDSTRTDAPGDAVAGDAVVTDTPGDGNKCRYTAGPGYSFLDCAPGRVCRMPGLTGAPTCEPGTDAGAPCGTIQCEGSCSCLDATKSICDCIGAAIGPLAPPELAA